MGATTRAQGAARSRGAARARGATVIYCLKEDGTNFVKVGITEDVWGRAGRIQVGNPRRLSIVGVIDGGEDEERRFHERFKAYRAIGEWFHDRDGFIMDLFASHGTRVDRRRSGRPSRTPPLKQDIESNVPDALLKRIRSHHGANKSMHMTPKEFRRQFHISVAQSETILSRELWRNPT